MEEPEPEADPSEGQESQQLVPTANSGEVQMPLLALVKDARVATAIAVAMVAGFGVGLVVSGRLWDLPPNYGDVPTWLAAGFAAIAGWVALRQLRMLREQVKEEADRNVKRDQLLDTQLAEAQARATSDRKRDQLLDRQLAEAEARSMAARRVQAEGVTVRLALPDLLWVINDSLRPITDITCQFVRKDTGEPLRGPDGSGTAMRVGPSQWIEPTLSEWGGERTDALAPGEGPFSVSAA